MKVIKPKPYTKLNDHWVVKYHANGKTVWSKGQIIDGYSEGYWQWFRLDGTLKRSGHFLKGDPVGEWITYDATGKPYKITKKKGIEDGKK